MEEPPPKRSLPSPRSTPQDQQTQQLHDNYWDEDASGPPSDTVAVKSDDHDAMNEEYGSAHKTPAEEVTDGTSNGMACQQLALGKLLWFRAVLYICLMLLLTSFSRRSGILTVLKNAKASATTFVSSVTSLFPKLPSVGWSKLSGERGKFMYLTDFANSTHSEHARFVFNLSYLFSVECRGNRSLIFKKKCCESAIFDLYNTR